MSERRNFLSNITSPITAIRNYLKKKFTKIVVVERVVVRMERDVPRIKERTIILYTDDPKYKNEQQNERLH